MFKTVNLTHHKLSEIESPVNRFYRTVWRWHFYAGLFVIPFMLLLAITGSIYLFKPQLDTLMYHHKMFVTPTAGNLSYTQQLNEVKKAYPGATATKFMPNVAPNRSSEVTITTTNKKNLTVFVNPHTGDVLGNRDEDHNLQNTVRKLHGELMIGSLGDYLIELAACWGLVLLLSGLYLWFPRRTFKTGGTLIPRVWHPNRRIVWRDLHSVLEFYGSVLIAFLILTGLPWAGFWGDSFAKISSQFPAYVMSDSPKSTLLTGTLNQQGTQTVPWAVERLPLPQSNLEHLQHQGKSQGLPLLPKRTLPTPVTLDTVVTLAKTKQITPGFTVSLPQTPTGVYTLSVFPDNPKQERTLHIDQYSGKILADVGWEDYGLVPKAVELGIAIHMGKYFGIGNQMLMLMACLVLGVVCISAVVMWWQRRPSDRLGAPTLPPYTQPWKLPIWIVAVLGIVFPLVGLSLITVLLLDYLLVARLPQLKRILS